MPEKKNLGDQKDIEENKIIAAIGYVWILCLVPLILKKDSKFAQYHAKQGLVLFIIEVIGSFVFWIPLIGWLLGIFVLVLAILGVVKALQGEYWEMPIVHDLSKKLNL